MANLLRLSARKPGSPALALLLWMALAVPLHAAIENPVAAGSVAPVEELTELEEVRVRGELVANVVISAENRVFRRYNKLNRNNRYDITCGDMRLDPNSLAMQRACVPDFFANFVPGYAVAASYSRLRSSPRQICGGAEPFTDEHGNVHAMISPCTSYDARFSVDPSYGSYDAYPIVVPADKRAEFSENVLRVIRSDPELLEEATELALMYTELNRVQAHFVKLRDEQQAARKAARDAARQRDRQRP